jgi:hypothetical protein
MSEFMLFCLGAGEWESKGAGYQKSYQIFNVQVEKEEWEKIKNSVPDIELPVAHWVKGDEMTAAEKKEKTIYKEIGGYLKVLSYEDTWKEWWNAAAEKDKKAILDIKYFDAVIFKGITGIDIKATPSLRGKEVEVKLDGVTYRAVIQ